MQVKLDEVKIRLKKGGTEVDSKTWANPTTMDLTHTFPDAKTNYGNGTYKATGEAKWTYTPSTFTETDDTSDEADVPCGPIGTEPTC